MHGVHARHGERQKPSVNYAGTRLEPICVRGTGRVENQLWAAAHCLSAVGTRYVQTVQHEGEVYVDVRVTLDDARRIGIEYGKFEAGGVAPRMERAVKLAERQDLRRAAHCCTMQAAKLARCCARTRQPMCDDGRLWEETRWGAVR